MMTLEKRSPNGISEVVQGDGDNSYVLLSVIKMEELGLFCGDSVLIRGKKCREAVCIALGNDKIDDSKIRMNCVCLGDVVSLHSTDEAKYDSRINVLSFEDSVEGITGSLFDTYLKGYFQDNYRPVKFKVVEVMIELPLRILLHGSGTGKTLMAKTVANETGAFYFVINDREITSKMANLRRSFEEAEKNAPPLFCSHRRNMELGEDVDLEVIADATHGHVGADLTQLCTQAALNCIREQLDFIGIEEPTIDIEILEAMAVQQLDFDDSVKLNYWPSNIRETIVLFYFLAMLPSSMEMG